MTKYIPAGKLSISLPLYELIEQKIAPGTGFSPRDFYEALEGILLQFSGRNKELLNVRDNLQQRIDEWHLTHKTHDPAAYKSFLYEIGYLVQEGDDFMITTNNVDPEIASIAGPQLVVPVTNSRYSLNAANARWGSLYDALYGTDVISDDDGAAKDKEFNPIRGAKVVQYGAEFLDIAVPLETGSHNDAINYDFGTSALRVTLQGGSTTTLANPEQFIGYVLEPTLGILLKNNGLHIEIQIDHEDIIGKTHLAGVKDVIIESAITTIADCEDSVAVVDGADKALTYGNWLGLIKGDLSTELTKGGKTITRTMQADREYIGLAGESINLSARSLLLIRNVGHLMTTDAILLGRKEIPEGILDAAMTGFISLHDTNENSRYGNSKCGSTYIVKPKMHGVDEVKFTCELFSAIEGALGLTPRSLKLGIMDEERRTTLNLKECIRAAKNRVIFINTGFLDRTGDEIHTSMEAGPMVPKNDMKSQSWIIAYEDWNVDTGLNTGFSGKAQIGKGMWPKPDMMREMVETKIAHPEAGTNCAWVPSPTAATLHAMHYHAVNVFTRQNRLLGSERANIDELLTIPLLTASLTKEVIQHELDNNVQGILGYVVRWIDQGVGCSKVPDITNVGLMEDRATLRISSQYLANWMHHNICSEEQVMESLKRMAVIVDKQNVDTGSYTPMSANFENSIAFKAACDLIFKGRSQPNGYTEPILHARRQEKKIELEGLATS